MNLVRTSVVLGILGALGIAGCAVAPDEEVGSGEGAATPSPNKDVFTQVQACDNLFKVHAKDVSEDIGAGVLRWQCGDVPEVTMSKCEDNLDKIAERERTVDVDTQRENALTECRDGFGQEYCEYNAVSNGNVVNTPRSAKDLKATDEVECVFTSVHSDVEDRTTPEYHKELSAELKPQLITATRPTIEGRVAGMKQGVNSRSAADTLISDCSNLGASSDAKLLENAQRQVLCYRAWKAAPANKRTEIAARCIGKDLSDDAVFAKTGLSESVLSEPEKDLAACTMILKAEHGGVDWRNSDTAICARSFRATNECNVTFKTIRDVAPNFQGFSMRTWSKDDTAPPGCKYADVKGEPFKQIVICKLNSTDVLAANRSTIPLGQRKSLQQVCNVAFGFNVAMQAPMGALANLSNAKKNGEFCSQFIAGAEKAQ